MGALGVPVFDTVVPAGEQRNRIMGRMVELAARGVSPRGIAGCLAVYEGVELSHHQVWRQLRRIEERQATIERLTR